MLNNESAAHEPVASSLTFAEACAYLDNLAVIGSRPGREAADLLLRELGVAPDALPSVQVVGTNGKGSTARYTAALLRSRGQSVGLFTSPHLVSYVERIEVDGVPVSEHDFARAIARVRDAVHAINQEPCRFAVLFAAACLVFVEEHVDVAVFEAGLGARLDPTSTLAHCAVAITSISFDHQSILGSTLSEIATEKAAALSAGTPGVVSLSAAQNLTVLREITASAQRSGAPMHLVTLDRLTRYEQALEVTSDTISGSQSDATLDKISGSASDIPKLPTFAAENIATAATLAELLLGEPLPDDLVLTVCCTTPNPARFEWLSVTPPVIIDACHNEDSVAQCLAEIKRVMPARVMRPPLLFAALSTKTIPKMLAQLVPEFDEIILCQTHDADSVDPRELALIIEQQSMPHIPRICIAQTVASALDALQQTGFVACGSLTLAGEIAALWRKDENALW